MAQTERFRPVCANAIREPWQFDTEIAIKLSAATGLPAEHRRMVGGEKEREGANGGQGYMPPLPRRAHLAQIESARRCWFHEHRSADHAETFNETLCRKFTCDTARLFVRQDSRTSVAICTACRPNRMSISLRYSSFQLIVHAELRLAYLYQRYYVDKLDPNVSGSRCCTRWR